MSLSKFEWEFSDEEDKDERIILAAVAKRRRLFYCLNNDHKGLRQGPAGPKQTKPRFDWDPFFAGESDRDFRLMFRLSKDSFTKALGYIQHLLEPRNKRKGHGNSGCILPAVRFAAALRLLAGGSSWDIKLAFCMYSRAEAPTPPQITNPTPTLHCSALPPPASPPHHSPSYHPAPHPSTCTDALRTRPGAPNRRADGDGRARSSIRGAHCICLPSVPSTPNACRPACASAQPTTRPNRSSSAVRPRCTRWSRKVLPATFCLRNPTMPPNCNPCCRCTPSSMRTAQSPSRPVSRAELPVSALQKNPKFCAVQIFWTKVTCRKATNQQTLEMA